MITESDVILKFIKDSGPVKSLSSFIEILFTLKEMIELPLTYRGESNSEWYLAPKLFRKNYDFVDGEKQIMMTILSQHHDEFLSDKSAFEKLVRMQHFGVPTRLLDLTSNPMVALYFATQENEANNGRVIVLGINEKRRKYFDSDTVAMISNQMFLNMSEIDEIKKFKGKNEEFNDLNSIKKLVEYIKLEKNYFEPRILQEDLKMRWFVKPQINNPRVLVQSGEFLLFGDTTFQMSKPIQTEFEKSNPIKQYKITVDFNSKNRIRKELEILGISDSTIFPGLETTSRQISEKYKSIK